VRTVNSTTSTATTALGWSVAGAGAWLISTLP
jgi:hypothetical protein